MNIAPYIAFYFFACAVYIIYRNWQVKQWPFTEGDLIECRVGTITKSLEDFKTIDFARGFNIAARVEFLYEIDGKKYSGNRLSFTTIFGSVAAGPFIRKQIKNIEMLSNNKVKVYYSPSNPKKSTLLKPNTFSWLFGFSLFPLAVLFLFVKPILI